MNRHTIHHHSVSRFLINCIAWISNSMQIKSYCAVLSHQWFCLSASKQRNIQYVWIVCVSLNLLFNSMAVQATTDLLTQSKTVQTSFAELVNKMPSTKLKNMSSLIDKLEGIQHERLLPLYESLLEGKLYYLRQDKTVIILGDSHGEDTDSVETFSAIKLIDGVTLSSVEKTAIKKIKSNNKLRKQLRKSIAKLTLFSEDATRRLKAVDKILNDLSAENVALLQQLKLTEKNKPVQKKIDLALLIAQLDVEDKTQKLTAINALSGELHPAVRARLINFIENYTNKEKTEHDAVLVKAASSALQQIDSQLKFYRVVERIFFGLSLGSVLLLAAIGLSITFGVMGVINMAHGELLMLGAYTTYVIQLLIPNHIGISIFVAIPAAFLVCGLVGIAIERGVIQFLKGRPLETLLATFGLSLILQQTVRSVFSPLNRQVSTPDWMSGVWQINPGLAITYNRLYIILFSLIVFTILLLVMKKTSLGLYVRAVSQNRDMAKAVGIRSEWVDAMTFGLGSGIAGVAGVALSQLTNVGPNLGQAYIIDSFMVVVFGGVGNLWGTLVGAFSLGIVSKFLEPITGTVLAQIIVLIFIVLFIQKRPKGLFPQQGRAAE